MARSRRKDLRSWLSDRSIPEPNTGCWLWLGWCDRDGYGKPGRSKSTPHRTAHRISYEAHHGRIPHGLAVLHRCDTPSCINPDHLFLGSQRDNMRDMISKSRRASFKGSRHGMSKLTEDEVARMRAMRAIGVPTVIVATAFNMSPRHARDILSGRLWRHVP